MHKRYLNRKFIRAVAALLTALLVIFRPEKADKITNCVMNVASALVALLTAGGFLYQPPEDDTAPDGPAKKGDVK